MSGARYSDVCNEINLARCDGGLANGTRNFDQSHGPLTFQLDRSSRHDGEALQPAA